MRRLAGVLALVMVLTMVSVPVFAEEVTPVVVAEPETTGVGMDTNFVVFDDDFSDNANGWELSGPAEIRDGRLYLATPEDTAEEGTGLAKLAIPAYDTKGNWYVNYKVKAEDNGGGSSGDNLFFAQMGPGVNQSGRLYYRLRRITGDFYISDKLAPAIANEGLTAARPFSGGNKLDFDPEKIFEILIAFRQITLADGKTYDCYDFYRRPVDEDGYPTGDWAKMNDWREAYWHDGNAGTTFYFMGGGAVNLGVTTYMDDLRMYQESYAKLGEPYLSEGVVDVDGSFMYGAPDTTGTRSFTQLTAVYDKKYGYTKKVFVSDRTATPTDHLSLSDSYYDMNVSPETDTVAAMLWDSVETGIPMVQAKDGVNRNVADTIYESDPVVALSNSVNYNEVIVEGYLGMGQILTASLVEKATGNVAAVAQTTTNSVGKAKVILGVDPANWASGTYILRTQTGSAVAESQEVELFTNDILGGGVTNADEMKYFLANYAAEEIKSRAEEEGFAAAIFNQYQVLAGENAGATDLYAFREALDPAVQSVVDERAFLAEINREIGASVVVWGNVRNLITETYAEILGLTETDISKINSVNDQKALFTAFNGKTYQSKATLLADLRAKVNELLALQNAISGGGVAGGGNFGGDAGGGGGFGGGNYLSGEKKGDTTDEPAKTPMKPIDKTNEGALGGFNDLTSVPWAQDSILALQKMNVISGDGSGSFAPDRAVTREEFLKMAMTAAGIEPGGSVSFSDVDANEWYYGYVAAAFEKGIVNGMDENTFGIGEKITRADMAVMLKRILDYAGIEIVPTENAYVFDDYKTIPKYARESITSLCQVGLMNGVGDNMFDAPASATRAESAVAIYRIYNYIAERR